MSQPDDVINQLILDLMNDMLPLTEGLAEGLKAYNEFYS